jgi:hypothetical protein
MDTANTSSVWTVESSQDMQAVYGVVGLIVGGAFIYASRIQSLERITSISVLFLGLLIFVISFATLVMGGKQVISVDPRRRLVEVQSLSRLGAKKRVIPFGQISDVFIGELGDKEGGSISYHVVLKLKNGKEVALFIGAFEGAYDRQAMEVRRRRLNDYLQAHRG